MHLAFLSFCSLLLSLSLCWIPFHHQCWLANWLPLPIAFAWTMELRLGLALLPTSPLDLSSRAYDEPNKPLGFSSPFNRKRTLSQLSDARASADHHHNDGKDVTLPTLPLLPLTPNHDGDDRRSNCSTTIITKSDENDVEAGPVGWPPVNSWRKKLRCRDQDDEDDAGNDQMVWIHHHHGRHGSVGSSRGSNNTLYVKVKMEGVGIARKVDLSMHHSFGTLKDTLLDMFGKCHQFSKCYELAYQDEEGDWLLAEDVPWRSFIQCAQRLKLLRSSSG